MLNKPIVELKKLHKNYVVEAETVKALRGVDISIAKGEFVSIMGASGSGKSTLLNIIGCLDKPTSGSYFIGGEDIKTLDRDTLADIRNRKLGFVFQSFNLLPRTTAIENVELPLLYNLTLSSKQRCQKAKDALEMVGLADRMYHLSNQMSGGQQQRVAIARSLVNDPLLILADEATGNLDSSTSYEIMSLLQKLNEMGKTIAFVTHEADISSFTKRRIVLHDGIVQTDKKQAQKSAQEAAKKLREV